jgi:hypothetical protein
MTRSRSRSEHGNQGGNGTTGSGAVPMERAYGGTDPQDVIHFPDDDVVCPEDSISCLNGAPIGDDEERSAGEGGSSDILDDDSELWTQRYFGLAEECTARVIRERSEDVLEGGSSRP